LTVKPHSGFAVQSDELTSYREIHISFMLILAVRHGSRSRAAKHITIQVKYTNPSGSKGLTIVLFSRHGADDLGSAGTRGKSGKCDAFGPDEREVVTSFFPCQVACLLLDQIKREKGVWWMPWQQEAMKDVILCDKLGGAENRL
jgi:hypothetical protein